MFSFTKYLKLKKENYLNNIEYNYLLNNGHILIISVIIIVFKTLIVLYTVCYEILAHYYPNTDYHPIYSTNLFVQLD